VSDKNTVIVEGGSSYGKLTDRYSVVAEEMRVEDACNIAARLNAVETGAV
jgi:hypothetical protein